MDPKKALIYGEDKTLEDIFLVRGPGPKSGNFFKSPEGISTLQSFVFAPRSQNSNILSDFSQPICRPDLQEACLRGDLGLVKRLIAANASVTRLDGCGAMNSLFGSSEKDGIV